MIEPKIHGHSPVQAIFHLDNASRWQLFKFKWRWKYMVWKHRNDKPMVFTWV